MGREGKVMETIFDFLYKLQRTPRKWYLVRNAMRIRHGAAGCECPISAVYGSHCYTTPASHLAKVLAIPGSPDIVFAADSCDAEPYIRQTLLNACGLNEGS